MKKFLFGLLIVLIHFSALEGTEGTEGSIVCIHGFMRTWRSMQHIAVKMKRTGIPTYIWDYPSRDKTISEHAHCLNELLKYIACKNPGEPINFVSHSLGALVLRRALNFPDCPEEAKMGRAVLLAPPNQGAFVARHLSSYLLFRLFFGSHAGYELMTYTGADIAALGNFPPEMDVLVVAGNRGVHPFFNGCPNDGKLALFETYLNTPHFHAVVSVRHSSIMNSRCTATLCRNFILHGWPQRPESLTNQSDSESEDSESPCKEAENTAETGR